MLANNTKHLEKLHNLFREMANKIKGYKEKKNNLYGWIKLMFAFCNYESNSNFNPVLSLRSISII